MNKSNSQYYTKKKEPLGESAASRRREMDEIKMENGAVRKELETYKEKMRGHISRNKILDSELKNVKMDYEMNKQLLLEKSENDNKYIGALKSE